MNSLLYRGEGRGGGKEEGICKSSVDAWLWLCERKNVGSGERGEALMEEAEWRSGRDASGGRRC